MKFVPYPEIGHRAEAAVEAATNLVDSYGRDPLVPYLVLFQTPLLWFLTIRNKTKKVRATRVYNYSDKRLTRANNCASAYSFDLPSRLLRIPALPQAANPKRA
jgi:hypothetical protein